MITHWDIIDFIKKVVKSVALEVFPHFNQPSNSIKQNLKIGFFNTENWILFFLIGVYIHFEWN